MAITDLTGTIWTFNDVIDFSSIQSTVRYNINFTTHFDSTLIEDATSIYLSQNSISYYVDSFLSDIQVYNGSSWYEGTDNIVIEGGTDATNANLIAWLQTNATQYIEPHDIVISYAGSTITMDNSGTEVLEAGGTFVTDDITIQYTKSSGTLPQLQTKSATPTTSSQTIEPDSGYYGLSSVEVGAIPQGYIIPSGSQTITTNNTYNVTSLAEVVVNIPSTPSPWTFIKSAEFTASTTSTYAQSIGTITCGSSLYTKSKIIYVRIRDKAGKRAGYFLGTDSFFINTNSANGSTSAFQTPATILHRYTTGNAYGITIGNYGIYAGKITTAGVVTIYKKYSANYSLTVDGTFVVEIYTLDYPDGKSIFDWVAPTT